MTALRDGDLHLRKLGSAPFGLYASFERAAAGVTVDEVIGVPIMRIARQLAQSGAG